MPQYLVRVELNMHPSVVAYRDEHSVMSAHGFCKTMRGKDCTQKYDLPAGTYLGESSSEPFVLIQQLQFFVHRATGKRVQVTAARADAVDAASLFETQ